MLFLFRTFVAFCLIVVVVGAVLAVLVSEKRPLVRSNPQIVAADLNRVKEILTEHDPRRLKAGTIRTLTLNGRELTFLTNHLLSYYYGSGAAEVELQGEKIRLKATLPLPARRWGLFLNLKATWVQDGDSLRAGLVHVGGLPVPGWLVESVLRTSLRLLGEKAVVDLFQRVTIAGDKLRVTYRWQPELVETVRRRVVSKADAGRLQAFHTELIRLADEHARRKRLSTRLFLKGLFTFASKRLGEDPVADNRAILMVLGAYVNRRGLEELVPEARAWRVPRQLTLTLGGRKDLALHFLTSAALAVTGGGFFSDTMGVYKEIADADRGSGFSFSDLAADRAGTRFSELATKSPESAQKLWSAFAGPVQESYFLPSIKNLPEFKSASAFRARFGTVGSRAYNRVAQDIEQRIATLPLYRKH